MKKQTEEILQISGVDPSRCMKCGKCSAACPAAETMDVKPHQFAACVLQDEPERLLGSRSLWVCLGCSTCVQRCPRDVKPGKILDAARQVVLRQRGNSYLTPEEIPERLDEETPQQLLVSAFRKYRR